MLPICLLPFSERGERDGIFIISNRKIGQHLASGFFHSIQRVVDSCLTPSPFHSENIKRALPLDVFFFFFFSLSCGISDGRACVDCFACVSRHRIRWSWPGSKGFHNFHPLLFASERGLMTVHCGEVGRRSFTRQMMIFIKKTRLDYRLHPPTPLWKERVAMIPSLWTPLAFHLLPLRRCWIAYAIKGGRVISPSSLVR